MPAAFYGINAGPVILTLSEDALAVHLNAIREAGIGQVRTDSGWHLAEPQAPVGGVHRYDWTYSDRVTAALARAGLTWYALLDYGTPWAGRIPGDPFSPPVHVEDYAAYAGAFARRYGPGGDFWRLRPELPARPVRTLEMWNEPNVVGFWHPVPDAAVYASMLAAAADAVDAVDPSLRVVVGGLDNTGPSLFEGPDYVAAMLAARPDLRGKVDGVGIHDYNTTPEATAARLRKLRPVVDRLLGPAIALDVTEAGWATAGLLPPVLVAPPVPEATRAGLYRSLVDRMSTSDCTIGALIPYAWVTPEGLGVSQNDFFGIADRSGALKPSAAAFREAVLRAEARPAPAAPLDICHRPDAALPDVPAAVPPTLPAVELRASMAPRSACRAGRPLLRIRVTGGAPRVRLLLDRGGRRTLPVPAAGVLRVRLPARTRRVTLTAPTADGGQARAAVRVRTRCPRPSARRLAAR